MASGECVAPHLDPAGPVEQGRVEPRLAALPVRLTGKELGRGGQDARDLPRADPLGGKRMGPRALDLHEDDRRAVAADQVDLAPLSAPATCENLVPEIGVMPRHLILRRIAGEVISQRIHAVTLRR